MLVGQEPNLFLTVASGTCLTIKTSGTGNELTRFVLAFYEPLLAFKAVRLASGLIYMLIPEATEDLVTASFASTGNKRLTKEHRDQGHVSSTCALCTKNFSTPLTHPRHLINRLFLCSKCLKFILSLLLESRRLE